MLSHQIAVNAYLIYRDQFLLLKRANPPAIWGPPGGRLNQNENPISGLMREIREETGLKCRVYQPVTTWFGQFNSKHLLSIDYLCVSTNQLVLLSEEHTAYRWCSINDLYEERKTIFADPYGFKFSDYLHAWITYLFMEENWIAVKKIYANADLKKYLPTQIRSNPE